MKDQADNKKSSPLDFEMESSKPWFIAAVECRMADVEQKLAQLDMEVKGLVIRSTSQLTATVPRVEPPAIPQEAPRAGTVPYAVRRGVVIDAGKARSSPCTRIAMPDGSRLVISPGLVGPLDTDQEALFCAEGYKDLAVTPEKAARILATVGVAEQCRMEAAHLEEGTQEHIDAFMACVNSRIGDTPSQSDNPTPRSMPDVNVTTSTLALPGGLVSTVYTIENIPESELQIVSRVDGKRSIATFYLPSGRRGAGYGQAMIHRALHDGPIILKDRSDMSDGANRVIDTMIRKELIVISNDADGTPLMHAI